MLGANIEGSSAKLVILDTTAHNFSTQALVAKGAPFLARRGVFFSDLLLSYLLELGPFDAGHERGVNESGSWTPRKQQWEILDECRSRDRAMSTGSISIRANADLTSSCTGVRALAALSFD